MIVVVVLQDELEGMRTVGREEGTKALVEREGLTKQIASLQADVDSLVSGGVRA
jgi:hypothetical protein